MTTEELNEAFEEAVNKVNSYTDPLPADLLLRLYAYYKIAKQNRFITWKQKTTNQCF